MGKTVPSYRIALELEIATWKAFGKALNSEGQEAFSELMDICRGFATASGNACNPVIFENMAISVLLAQQKKLQKLEQQAEELCGEKFQTKISGSSP